MKALVFISILLLISVVKADDDTRAAVHQVQQEMKNPKFHENAAKSSPEAKKVESQIKELAGNPENEQELYNLAAEVLGNMKDRTPEEMMKILQEAQRDPAAYADKWTPEQKRKLKELVEKLPASQRRNP